MVPKPPYWLTLSMTLALCVISLCETHAAERVCKAAKPGEALMVDFKDTPLKDVVRFVSCAAGLNTILDPPSLANHVVTVVAPRPVKVEDLVPLLTAAARHAGLVVQPKGRYLLIRPDPSHVPSKRRSNKGR